MNAPSVSGSNRAHDLCATFVPAQHGHSVTPETDKIDRFGAVSQSVMRREFSAGHELSQHALEAVWNVSVKLFGTLGKFVPEQEHYFSDSLDLPFHDEFNQTHIYTLSHWLKKICNMLLSQFLLSLFVKS